MNQVDSEMLKSINTLYIKASADIDAYTEDDCSYLDKDKFHEYVDKASNKCTEFRVKVYEFVEDIEDNGLVESLKEKVKTLMSKNRENSIKVVMVL